MNLPIGTSNMNEGKFADDPVIPKGSPLQEYLNSLCLNDDGYVSDYFRKKQDSFELQSNHWYKDSIKALMARKWIWIRGMLSSIFPISKSVVREVCQNYYYQYGEEIVGSKIILDEDLDFLCLQTPQIFVDIVRKDKKVEADATKKQDEVSKLNIIVFSALFVLCLSILFESIMSPYLHAAIFLFVFVFVIFNVRLKITKEIWRKKLHSNLSIIKDLLRCSFKFLSISRQSIRMAQELEVVSLGYRLVNGTTPATRLEQSAKNKDKRRSCERLRSLLLRSTVHSFLTCREATLQLIRYLPDGSTHNKRSQRFNISHEILENLHPCLIAVDDLELYEASDGFSLASLKALNGLLRKQISEFITHLFICLSTCTWDFSKEGLLLNLIRVLLEPLQTMGNSLKSVRCCYEMHKYVTRVKPDANKPRMTRTDDGAGDKKYSNVSPAFLIHLHSLQVHMRNAILMSIEMDERLSKCALDDGHSYATGLLDNIEHHIGVAADCLLKCSSEMKQETKETDAGGTHVKTLPSPLPRPEENFTKKVAELDDIDYTEDQVFEAIVDGDDGSKEMNKNSEDSEETADSKINREKSCNLMRELRSVLAVKTSVQEREERKKKLFPNYKPKPPHEEGPSNDDDDESKSSDDTIRNMFSFYTKISNDNSAQSDGGEERPKEEVLNYSAVPFARPSFGHRPCTRRARHERMRSSESPLIGDEQEEESARADDDSSSDEDGRNLGVGFGFSHSIAAQAAAMAKQRAVALNSENIISEVIGDD